MKLSKYQDFIFAFMLYMAWAALETVAECPLNAVYQAQMCTAELGIGPSHGPKPFVEKGKIEMAKRACSENRLNDAVKCLEDIMEVCQGNTEREHVLNMMIDVDNIKQSVQRFCNNIDVYEENAECIADSHLDQKQCAQDVRDNFKTKVDSTSNIDVMMTSTCRFFSIAVNCVKTIVKPKCGQAAMDIVVDMLQGFQPPKCRELDIEPGYRVESDDSDNGNHGNSLSSILSTTLFSLILIKFFI